MRLEHGALHGEADDHDHFTDVSPDVLKVQPELHRYVFQTRDIEVKPYTYSPEETPEHLQALQIPGMVANVRTGESLACERKASSTWSSAHIPSTADEFASRGTTCRLDLKAFLFVRSATIFGPFPAYSGTISVDGCTKAQES